MQADLFSTRSFASTVTIPPAPELVPHSSWPFPGLTPEDSARGNIANSAEYADMLAALVLSRGGDELTGGQVLTLVPADWRALLGRFAHSSMAPRQAEERGIAVRYVGHEGRGFHFTYRPNT